LNNALRRMVDADPYAGRRTIAAARSASSQRGLAALPGREGGRKFEPARRRCSAAMARHPLLGRFIAARRAEASAKAGGWGGRIRTSAWGNQNPLPYRLATPHRRNAETAASLITYAYSRRVKNLQILFKKHRHVAFMLRPRRRELFSAQQSAFRGCQFLAVVSAWKQVAVYVERHRDC
jgi:hypothetical protein